MTKRADDEKAVLSRRDLLKRVGFFGAAAAAVPVDAFASSAALAVPPAAFPPAQVQARREPLETLAAAEADTLEAIVARLIPTDETDLALPRPARPTTSIARSAAHSRRRSTRTVAASQPSMLRPGHQGRAVRPALARDQGCGIERHGDEHRHRLRA